MQSRFELRADTAMLSRWSGLPLKYVAAAPQRRSFYDHAHYPVLRVSPTRHAHEVVWMREGLIPSYAHDEQDADKRAEAHAEALTCDSCFRAAFRRRRCLIPAQVLHESGQGKQGHDYACSFAIASGDVFSMAAIWETWCNDQGHTLDTFAIITTLVTPLLRPIVHRMPVVIAPPDRERWLSFDRDADAPVDLLKPLSNADLTDWKLMPEGIEARRVEGNGGNEALASSTLTTRMDH